MSIVASSARPVSRIIFNACQPRRPVRPFGQGVLPDRSVKQAGHTAEDAAWFDAILREMDTTTPTVAEEHDRRNMLTMSAREFRDLCMELEQMERDSYDRWVDARAEDAELADRFESLPSRNTHHLIISDELADPSAVILENVDASNLIHAAARARMVADVCDSDLKHTAIIARGHDGSLALMNRDVASDTIRFTGHMKVRASAIESAFGCKLPPA